MEFLSKIITSVFGINVKPNIGDIASPSNGDIWYNSTVEKFRKRENGSTTDLAPTITYGTAAPSGGNDGDIYLQYTA
jgi:hypothetical protein